MLDVGHTAQSPGAKSARGADEFDFNLRLAKLIDQALLDAGFAKTVLMVTDGPGVRSMYVRVAHANELGANLLLSIHHDSVPDKFLEKWEYDGKPETFSDRFKGHSIFVSDDNADLKDSLMFASMLGEQLKARGLQYTPHYTESFMGHYRHTLLDADRRRLSLRHAVRAEKGPACRRRCWKPARSPTATRNCRWRRPSGSS